MIKKGIVGLAALAAILVLAGAGVFYAYNFNRQPENEGSKSGWEPHQKVIDDPADDLAGKPAEVKSGYDIRGVWFRYDESKDIAHFRLDTEGVAGDVDGDGDPDNSSVRDILDTVGIGLGETYRVICDTDLDNFPDVFIIYEDNSVTAKYTTDFSLVPSLICKENLGENKVEIEVSNASSFLTTNFQIRAFADSEDDGWGEDYTSWTEINLEGGGI